MPTQGPWRLVELGSRLRPLREEGIPVFGSGFMTHGLRSRTHEMIMNGAVPAWSSDFDAWAADALTRGHVAELAAYQSRAPGMPYAHPTADHYIPLFATLGAADQPDGPVHTTIDGYMIGFS